MCQSVSAPVSASRHMDVWLSSMAFGYNAHVGLGDGSKSSSNDWMNAGGMSAMQCTFPHCEEVARCNAWR
jgi:hypothetical protein